MEEFNTATSTAYYSMDHFKPLPWKVTGQRLNDGAYQIQTQSVEYQ